MQTTPVASSLVSSVCPVGTVVSWDKTLTGTPQTLPANWVECNGQTITDARSPYFNTAIRNINGGNRFIRPGSTSGSTAGADSHTHTLAATFTPTTQQAASSTAVTVVTGATVTGTAASASNLPAYITMVQIMRIF